MKSLFIQEKLCSISFVTEIQKSNNRDFKMSRRRLQRERQKINRFNLPGTFLRRHSTTTMFNCLMSDLDDDVFLLLRPEFISFFLSYINVIILVSFK